MRAVSPDAGAEPYLLPFIVGLPNALELMYSGEIIDAQRALEIGLVGRVLTPEKLLDESKAFAQRMAAGAPMATRAVKELTYGALSMPYAIFNVEKTLHLQETSNSEDASEGVQSFLEKRPPVGADDSPIRTR